MMGIGYRELIILMVIVLVIFGPKNLPRLAQSIGQSVRELKKGLSGLGDDLKETEKREERPASRTTASAVTTPPGTSDAQPVERGNDTQPRNA